MTISLPFDRQVWPLARIVTAPRFNGAWKVQPMWNSRTRGAGFELLTCTRACLPAVGEATFQYRYGVINGLIIGAKNTGGRQVAGAAWDPAQDAAQAPDLNGYDVRIQMADPPVSNGSQLRADPAWRTVWWGQVEYQEDSQWPGANYPAGVRTYRCLDGFARAKRWQVNRHSVYTGGGPDFWFLDVEGHPGYNTGNDGRILGNRNTVDISNAQPSVNPAIKELQTLEVDPDGKYFAHTNQGDADALTWTVQQSLEHALRVGRGMGEPRFSFDGSVTLLADTIAIPVREGDTAWDLVARNCRRERGRGVVFVDWADDVAAPLGPLAPVLRIRPQTVDNIDYTTPGALSTANLQFAAAQTQLAEAVGEPALSEAIAALEAAGDAIVAASGSSAIAGATTAGTTVAVDLINDHRLEAGEFQLSGRNLHTADAVETTSEQIQVMVTLSYYDGDYSLEKKWTTARESTFAALLPGKRADEAWEPMWQLHGLPRGWGGNAKDHNGGALYGVDFACADDGSLITSASEKRSITSPLLCKIMPDLPLMEGYDYSGTTPVRKIGSQVAIDETGQPSRRKLLPLVRVSADKYLNGDDLNNGDQGLHIYPRQGGLFITSGDDQRTGRRFISDRATTALHARYDLSQLGITVGIELPHRVRRRTVTDPSVPPRRTVSVRLPDLHLWLAHSGAIWDLNYADSTSTKNPNGVAPRRNAMGAAGPLPGLLRDDRDTLSRIHAMACAWYLTQRQTAKWALRACGLLPSFNVGEDGEELTAVTYPTMGQLVTTIAASGQTQTINTPITSVSYDHTVGKTTWETDWQELDFQ